MRPPMRAAMALLLAASACQGDPTGTSRRAPIVNGALDPGDPAVANILPVGCSGTLISRRVILTAAHCLDGEAAPAEVYFGDGIEPGTTIAVEEWIGHPLYDPNDLRAGRDVGMILLAEAPPVAPVTINRGGVAGVVGREVRLVGFGVTSGDAADAGVKRTTRAVVSDITTEVIYTDGTTTTSCWGDSGGAYFLPSPSGAELQIGIISFGDGPKGSPDACNEYGAATRVDLFDDQFIMPWVEEHDVEPVLPAPGGSSAHGGDSSSTAPPPPDSPDPVDTHTIRCGAMPGGARGGLLLLAFALFAAGVRCGRARPRPRP